MNDHSWSRVAHYISDLISGAGSITVNPAVSTYRFRFMKRAFVYLPFGIEANVFTSGAHFGFWMMMRFTIQFDHDPNSPLFPRQSMKTIHSVESETKPKDDRPC